MSTESQNTSRIYTLIKDQEYLEAIKELNIHLEANPRSRAALSLLGYCNYLSGNVLAVHVLLQAVANSSQCTHNRNEFS